MLCRGEIIMDASAASKLYCRYVDNNNPFLKLARFKLEEVYPNPYIVIYHDVIYDPEIATIKRIAQPRVSFKSEISFYIKLIY